MPIVYLHLGSNKGNRLKNLQSAYENIEGRIGKILLKSQNFETAPWGNLDQSSFINSAIKVETTKNPFELLFEILSIEDDLGRKRTTKWAPRVIDIDIIFYENLVIQSSILTIPHIHYSNRKFVLTPLLDVVSDFIDPQSDLSITESMHSCQDTSDVKVYSDG